MINSMFNKLAIQNIKNNRNTFGPFLICTVTMISLFYMLLNATYLVKNGDFFGAEAMCSIMYFGCWVCGIFSVLVILYTNKFLIKKRSKELGLYSMLGMDKQHIGKVLFWEMVNTGLAGIAIGLIFGMTFSKLVFMGMERLIKLNTGIKFRIMIESVGITVAVFAAVFAVIIIGNFIRVLRMKPIELMRSTRYGEKEPKANWVLAIIGALLLGLGYYIAITTDNPIRALTMFFVAVILVIFGTYFTFISGSVAVLKILKKNRNYYYKKNHFITLSGLIYRMKQNAVGLANICILSTAVLVILFSTSTLLVGAEEFINSNYPENVYINWNVGDRKPEEFDRAKLEACARKSADKYNVSIDNINSRFYTVIVGKIQDGKIVETENMEAAAKLSMFYVLTAEDYERKTGNKIELGDNEFLWYSSVDRKLGGNELDIAGIKLREVGSIDKKAALLDNSMLVYETGNIIVKDFATLKNIANAASKKLNSRGNVDVNFEFSYDLDGKLKDKVAYEQHAQADYKDFPTIDAFNCKDILRQDYFNLFGSLFFIGIFIGIMFLVTTVMIIYYKQISEGYDDREKFQILRKVGMSDKETKATIRSQILTVFFVPIIVAVIHVAAAFKAIRKIMIMFGISSMQLMIVCLVATIVVYLFVYALIYSLTAKSYYKCLM